MSTHGWLLDPRRCIECRACETACKQWNQLPTGVGVRYRRVQVTESGKAPSLSITSLSMACNHCENPLCVKVCLGKALSKRADGLVLLDESKCVSCRQCEKFCPYGAPQFNLSTRRMQKCTMCADRIETGMEPACATLCPTGALKWGDWEVIRQSGDSEFPGFSDPTLTSPRMRFASQSWTKRS